MNKVWSVDENGWIREIEQKETKAFNGSMCYTKHDKKRYDDFFKYNKHLLIIGKPVNAPGYICLDTLADDNDDRPHPFLYWVVNVREWDSSMSHLYDGVAVKDIKKLAGETKIVDGEWEIF